MIEHAVCGKVYWMGEDGSRELLFDNLPGGGDHSTSDIVVAHSERLYFGTGTRTNSGVVGTDNAWWATRNPNLCDIPGSDITLAGLNFASSNLLGIGTAWTGAFQPFGIGAYEGKSIHGQPLCTGGIMRADSDGGQPSLFAWGFRKPSGLAVHADGRIFCADSGMENRGSRPVAGARAYIWEVVEGGWYGWPDFEGGFPVSDECFKPKDALQPEFLLRDRPELIGRPAASFPLESGIAHFDFSRSPFFAPNDTAFVSMAGTMDTSTEAMQNGFKVVSVDVETGEWEDFVTNRHPGPASSCNSGGLERPVAVKFDRTGEIMYILDLGIQYQDERYGIVTQPDTGVLWRVRPEEVRA